MWSASSSTAISTASRTAALRVIRSMSRPGVATMTSTPLRSSEICGPIAAPPNTTPTRRFSARATDSSSSATWRASSRVGTSTRPRGCSAWRVEFDRLSRVSIGSPNASVLPEPVWARPSTSRPASASATVRAWIGDGTVMPRVASMVTIDSGSPSSPNVVASTAPSSTTASKSMAGAATGRGPLDFELPPPPWELLELRRWGAPVDGRRFGSREKDMFAPVESAGHNVREPVRWTEQPTTSDHTSNSLAGGAASATRISV